MDSPHTSLLPSLRAVKRGIQTMKIRGAAEIGLQAVGALASAAESFRGASKEEFDARVLEAARDLAQARPTAVTLRNGLNELLMELPRSQNVADAKRRLGAAATAYARRVDEAKDQIAVHALAEFRPRDVILTHCHSTVAGHAIAHAHDHLPGLRVFATETRPFRQGLIQAPALARRGVDVTLIVDSAVAHILDVEHVTRVVVGADAVAADGALYNKIGTRQVAELARRFDVPFLVCAERDKFNPYTLHGAAVPIEERDPDEVAHAKEIPGVKVRNPVFDRTPPELVTAYVTEQGRLEPKKVRRFIEKELGGLHPWV